MATKNKIMILDDDPAFTAMMRDYFKTAGYDVHIATNMEEGIEQFKTHKPKVVLLDYNMPQVNGDQFLPLFQQIEPSVKAIIITGYTADEVQGKFSGLGYFGFFEKGSLSLVDIRKKIDEAFSY